MNTIGRLIAAAQLAMMRHAVKRDAHRAGVAFITGAELRAAMAKVIAEVEAPDGFDEALVDRIVAKLVERVAADRAAVGKPPVPRAHLLKVCRAFLLSTYCDDEPQAATESAR